MYNYSWCSCVSMIITPIYSFSEGLSFTPTWLDNLRCSGTESRLINCPANSIEVEDCDHFEDIALICTTENSTTSKNRYNKYKYCVHIVLRPLV